MSSTVIDRRFSSNDKSSGSRRRFMERYRGKIKEAAEKVISGRGIKNLDDDGITVPIPKRDLTEPSIHHGEGGVYDRVLPGNKKFNGGERLPKPSGGGKGGQGNEASQDAEGQDEFVFNLTREEFLAEVFRDLNLPNLEKKTDQGSTVTQPRYAGRISEGPYSKLDIPASRKKRIGRQRVQASPYNKRIFQLLLEKEAMFRELEPSFIPTEMDIKKVLSAQIIALEKKIGVALLEYGYLLSDRQKAYLDEIDQEISGLKTKVEAVPAWNEKTDLRFAFHTPSPVPISKAAMFCLMDVSGSMDEQTKNTAKLFYFLLYRFLCTKYDQIDLVFIRHTQTARECTEQEFFYDTDTGGTIVSSALDLMSKIITERYSGEDWNIYGAQASDGDNFGRDNDTCCKLLLDSILPNVQGYFYVEIPHGPAHKELWSSYEKIKEQTDRFWMGTLRDRSDIFPVFREFFSQNGVISAFSDNMSMERQP